ncbi:MAG TPA: cbb3-type cytochrome c oxidase N-terminal domain-containing protein [Ignavibacteria bacterium]|nr:cbb3-type cytochrome c oxidase N-terminal domain-containing protein [Ignavibacteria bacterium]
MKKKFFIYSLFAEFLLFVNNTFAQTAEPDMSEKIPYIMLGVLGIIIAWIFFALMFSDDEPKVKVKKEKKFKINWGGIFYSLKPVQENDPQLEHEYDGIKELDNNLPPLLNYIFIFSLLFSVFYILHYHVFGTGDLSSQEYSSEMKVAQMERDELIKSGAFINEETAQYMKDDATLERGKTIYFSNCVICHGSKGEGLIGPNFTDEYWIHGGSIGNVFKTISVGVPEKGMISWKTQLSPKQIQAVASYILSLKGSNPPNGKQAEGILYIDSTEIKTDSLKKDSLKSK